MKPMVKQLSKRRPPWAGVLLHGGLVLVLVVLALVPGDRLPAAEAAGILTITSITGTYVVLDSNNPAAGPRVFTASAKVCNTGDAPLTDVVVNIGNGTTPGTFPTTTFGGQTYRLQTLDFTKNGDNSDATRSLGTIAVGQCVYVYWQLVYPVTSTALDGLVLNFTVWGTATGGITASVNDNVQLRSTISASDNKLNPGDYTLTPTGPYSIGQQVELCYTNVDFGVIGNGYNKVNDFWFQPVGTTAFNPDYLRLVKTTASFKSNKCLGPPQPVYNYEDITYFTTIDDGDWDGNGTIEACSGNSQQVTGSYCYTFVAIAPGTSTIQPYQEASGGGQQKYNGDYTGTTIEILTNNTCSVSLAKSADKDNVLQGQELTYTILFTNLTTTAVGAPPATTLQISDAIPSNTQYKLGSASCTGGTVYYSTDGGASYTSTEPASVPPPVTNLKCVLDDALAAAPGSGTLTYTVIAQDDNGVTAAPATSNFSGVQCSASQGVSTTPVTLSYFLASRSGETLHFEWSTATETGNVGFNVYAVGSGGRERVNAELIPSHVVDSLEPQDYVFEATGVDGDKFFVEDVDLFGRTRQHGPFVVGRAYGTRVVPEPIDWAAIRAEHNAKASARAAKGTAQTVGGQATLTQESSTGRSALARSVAASGPIQLLVEHDRLYRVSYEALLAAGFDLAGAKAADLALTNRGLPVPIYVESGAKFGPGAYLEFYGQAMDTLYTRTNVYILEVNRASAQRAAVDSTLPSDSAPLVPFYLETAAVEQNRQYSNSSPSSDPWYERRLFASSAPVEASFGLPVDHYVGDSAPSTLSVGVWGMIDWPRAPDHHLMAMLNETTVADEWFDGITDRPFSLTLPAGVLHEGLNTLKLRLPWDTGSQWDMVAVDSYSVTYPRAFVARDGALTFQAAGDRFRVEGLPEASAVVYRLDDDGLAKLTQLQIDGGSGSYSVTFAGSGSFAKYFVSTEAALSVPDIEAGRPPTDITSGTVSYIMIAHADFVDGLAPLVAARQAQSYTVRVVNVEDVYAQFGHGIFDAQAIRDYITYAANQMDTQYFLLVGGDTYDYRDYLGLGAMSFIPSLYAPTGPWVSFAPVDPLYTDLDGDGMPDRAIGRFPVRSAAELDALVSKTLAYGSKDYGATAVFAADAFDGQRSYADDSALFVQQLPGDWTVQEAYIDEVGLANARTALIDAMNSGVALTSFVGHSATTVWTFDGLFSLGDALNLTNIGRPTLVSQYGCWNNWYVATNYDTLAHGLLVSGLQGAAATLGPSTLADSSSEAALGQHLTSRLVESGMTLGAAIQAAKADLLSTGEGSADMLLGWVLLGDPTLVVQP